MRVLVYPHAMNVGGSQLNAIELAAAVRDLGHEVAVIGEEGPLSQRVSDLGLEQIRISARRRRPSPTVAMRLRSLIRERNLDVIHGYEWPPALDAAAATFGGADQRGNVGQGRNEGHAAAVCTIMSMAVAPFLPASMPLVVGTRALQQLTATKRPGPVHLIEPPVDVEDNSPGHPTAAFRAQFGLGPGLVDLVLVSRLAPELKLEGILTAIDVVGALARERPVRLIVVGDGVARDTVEQRAAKANAHAGRIAVVLTGQLIDPRPAYAAADIVLGMGGSALRALAFGRPLVVQGEHGFWELLTPSTVDTFLHQGWYGIGDGTPGDAALTAILLRLLADEALRDELGRYGRQLAVDRFSLQRAARLQVEIYDEAIALRRRPGGAAALRNDALRSLAGLTAHKARRRYESLRGRMSGADFNTATVAAAPLEKP